jgi:transposase-like protein
MSKTNSKVFETIKQRCINTGISMQELCRKSGVSWSTLNNWRRKTPKSLKEYGKLNETLKKIEDEKIQGDNLD